MTTSDSASAGGPEGRARTSRVIWAITATILVVLLVVAARRLDLARAAAELLRAKPAWIFAAVLSYATILPLWAAEWYLLAPPVPLGDLPC